MPAALLSRDEVVARIQDAVVRIEGALIVAGALDDPAPFQRALRNIERDLLNKPICRTVRSHGHLSDESHHRRV